MVEAVRARWNALSALDKAATGLRATLYILGLVGGAVWFLGGFVSLPPRTAALESRVDKLERSEQKRAALIQFLGCAEAARQQKQEDPSCLREYMSQSRQ